MSSVTKTIKKTPRSLVPHLKGRHKSSIHLHQLKLKKIAAKVVADRKEEAAAARIKGCEFSFPFGGSYTIVAQANKEVRGDTYLEANHSPPNDAYVGTPYESYSYGFKPAHAMLFYHHRAPRGSTGGLTSTGGSSFNKPWSAQLRELLKVGKFAEAMALDFNDILATTTPNRSFYALALHQTALYAFNVGLIDEAGMRHVSSVYGQHLSGLALGQAFTDSDVARSLRSS